MINIDRIQQIVKKKNQKSTKNITFLYQSYQNDNDSIFYRFNNRWMNFTVRGIAKEVGCSIGMINKTLNLLKSADLIEYEYISYKGYGRRRNTHDNKSIFFNAKGRAILKVLLTQKSGTNSQEEKTVNTMNTEAVNLNNYNINKSGETPKTLKTNPYSTESLCAKLYDEIERLKIPVKRNRSTARYIHAAAKKLACNRKIGIQIPTSEVISRFRRFLEHQINWLKLHGYKVCLHLLLKFKAIGAFLAQLFAPVYKKYEKVVKLQPKRKILLYSEDIKLNPDKYQRYCDLYGKENIEVKQYSESSGFSSNKQVTCLSKYTTKQPQTIRKRGCYSFKGILERFIINNIN